VFLQLTNMENRVYFSYSRKLQFISWRSYLLKDFKWAIELGCQFQILMKTKSSMHEWLKLEVYVTPGFNAKTRCSSYVCPGSSCHTYDQNVSIENQCLYYIVSYYKKLLQVQKGLNSGMDYILPQTVDRGFRTPRSLHQRTPLSSSA
jgi:hypothetical protein